MEYARILNLDSLLNQKSFFLVGPRLTGKSFLIRKQLQSKSLVINLLDGETFLRYSAEPSLITKTAKGGTRCFCVPVFMLLLFCETKVDWIHSYYLPFASPLSF